jgi:hypothetical protein
MKLPMAAKNVFGADIRVRAKADNQRASER